MKNLTYLLFLISFIGFSQEPYEEIVVCFTNESDVSQEKLTETSSTMLFSPTSIGAGIDETITLYNDVFGNEKGSIQFSTSTGAFFTILETAIVSWSNNEIKAKVPSQANTGKIKIIRSDGTEIISSSNLYVKFSNYNFSCDSNNDKKYEYCRTRHIEESIVLYYNPSQFSQNDIDYMQEKGIEYWKCETGIDWQLLPTNTSPISTKDGISMVIRGDSPGGAHMAVYWEYCEISKNYIFIEGDIVFDEQFKDAIVHEFGHRRGLGHTRNSNSCMKNTGGNTMSPDDREGGIAYTRFSNNNSECGTSTNFSNCSTLSVESFVIDRKQAHKTIIDYTGRIIAKLEPNENEKIFLSRLSSGFYIIKYTLNGRFEIQKYFVK